MHIPSEMLAGPVCPATVALATAGIAGSAFAVASKKPAARIIAKFALVTALVFGLQALNYPIFSGVSAHLLGGVLAAALLGIGGGVLSVALVVVTQAFFFADGGVDMLGANLFNMAVIGAGAGGLFRNWLIKRGVSVSFATGIAAAAAVQAATLALSVELAIGASMTSAAFASLIGLHMIAAVIEGVATVALVKAFAAEHKAPFGARAFATLAAAVVVCFALTAVASELPDAFEWTVERFL